VICLLNTINGCFIFLPGRPLSLNPQGAIVFPDDGISFIHRDETLSRVHGQHGEAHAEVRCEDFVPAETLDLVVVGAGEGDSLHRDKDNVLPRNKSFSSCRIEPGLSPPLF